MPDAAKLSRPGSPVGKEIRRVADRAPRRSAASPARAMMFSRTNRSSSVNTIVGSFFTVDRSPMRLRGQRHHLLESFLIAAGERRAARGRDRSAAPGPSGRTSARRGTRERRRTPRGSVASTSPSGTRSYVLPCSTNTDVVPEKYRSARDSAHAGYQAGRSCVAARGGARPGARRPPSVESLQRPRATSLPRSASRIAGGSASWSASPVRCWSWFTASSVCCMLSAAAVT